MNYQIFGKMKESEYAQREKESEQAYMERIFKAVLETYPKYPDKDKNFNDILAPEFCDCSADDRTLRLRYRPQSWQMNPIGILHGGIITAAIDMTVGMLTRFYVRGNVTVTVQMNVSFMREISPEQPYHVLARADKTGRRAVFLTAEVFDGPTGNIAAKAAAMFM